MKRLITCCALVGLAVLVGCSGDSPKPNPLPTPAPDVWGISSLQANGEDYDPDNPPVAYVNVPVLVTATITKNGAPAPNGTTVEFLAGGTLIDRVQSEGGTAGVSYVSSATGAVVVQVRVVDAVRSMTIIWIERDESENLQIYLPVTPDVGDRDGGEQVILQGKAIATPVEVYFTVEGFTHQAVVFNVQPSVPPTANGSITIFTPPITNIEVKPGINDPNDPEDPMYQSYVADIRVDVGIGTAKAFQTATYPQAFTFLPEATYVPDPPPPVAGNVPGPEIYAVIPSEGSSRGGEIVTVYGRNLGADWDYDLEEVVFRATDSVQVKFDDRDDLLGITPVVSPNGNQIELTTPVYSAEMQEEDHLVSVEVMNILDDEEAEDPSDNTFVKTEAFIFLRDIEPEPQPDITAVSPTAGPLDGGTVVTIFGSGFAFPVQVIFGELEAIVNDVTAEQIVCVTPDYSNDGTTPPFSVDVIVTNIETGNTDLLQGGFTFGDNLFINGNSPSEGGPGTLVTIYGAGFEDPLTVDFQGTTPELRLESPAVSGSQVIARFPTNLDPTCEDATGMFLITLTDRPASLGIGLAQGGSFTYLGNNPTVLSVEPPIVEERLGGDGVSPSDVTIHGLRFLEELLVSIGSSGGPPIVLAAEDIEVMSETQVDVLELPAPNEFQMNWDQGACVTPEGLNGSRNVPTAVDVTVTNIPGDCSDTLVGGLIYEPQDTVCRANPNIRVQPNPYQFGETPAGDCSDPVEFLVTNDGTGTLDVDRVVLNGRFYFDDDGTQEYPGAPFTLESYEQRSIFVQFCPDDIVNELYEGSMVFYSNDPNDNPYVVDLSATAPLPDIEFDPPSLGEDDFGDVDLGDCSPFLPIEVTNTGSAPLEFTAELAPGDDPPFALDDTYEDMILESGEAIFVGVQFCPETNDGELVTGVIEFRTNIEAKALVVDYQLEARNPGNPDILVIPDSIDFGEIPVGDSVASPITITNDGNDPLTWSAVVGGDDPDQYSIDNSGGTVAVGETDTINVTYEPTSVDIHLATVVITHDDPDVGPVTVELAGEGVDITGPVLSFEPAALDFGTLVNDGSADLCTEHQAVTVTNDGDQPLIFSAVLEGPHETHYDFDDEASYQDVRLLEGESRPVWVRFCPDFDSLGLLPGEDIQLPDAWIQFESNDPDPLFERADLDGTAEEPGLIEVTPLDLDFGEVHIADTADLEITVRNIGNVDLDWEAIITLDTDHFSLVPIGPQTTAVGDTKTITVTFDPGGDPGVHTGRVEISHNDPDPDQRNPILVELVGEGIDPPPSP